MSYFCRKLLCINNMIKQRTKTVNLHFKRTELLYDVKNYAYIEGDVMKTNDEHDRHQVMDIGEDGNVDRVSRVLDLGMARCTELCYPFSKREVAQGTALDDTLTEAGSYILRLLVPDDFSRTTVVLLERLIHELLVYYVIADWLSITNPEKAPIWQAKINDVEESIKGTINNRVGRARKFQSPF